MTPKEQQPVPVDENPKVEMPAIKDVLDRHAVAEDRPERGAPRIAIGIAGEPHARSLVAAGELITMKNDEQTNEGLRRAGYRTVEVSEECDDIFRWRKQVDDAMKLPELANEVAREARSLRANGVSASVHRAFVAGGITIKRGLNADEPIKGSDAEREWREVADRCAATPLTTGLRVVIIDTGLPEENDWRNANEILSSIAVDASNVDPLNVIGNELIPGGPRVSTRTGKSYDRFLDFGAGHGTVVAGVVRQHAPSVPVYMYRGFDSDGIGFEALIACAIRRAVADAPKDELIVFNLSFGMYGGEDDTIPYVLDGAIRNLDPAKHVVVAAAGNNSAPRESYPAALPEVIAVGSVDQQGRRSYFSSYGWWVDTSAVGERVISTFVDGYENPKFDPSPDDWADDPFPLAACDGTSFATPKIAATIARLIDAGATPQQACDVIRKGGPTRKGLGTVYSDDALAQL
jgi:hypothetical protein